MRQYYQSTLERFAQRARESRGRLFRECFSLDPHTRILDLGSGDGQYISLVTAGTSVQPSNVWVADILPAELEKAEREYGFTPVRIPEMGLLPFPDQYFDIVFCNSVIEHVTLPKAELWSLATEREFRVRSLERQRDFAREIRRVGRGYFVQTPHKWFPLDPHTQLPFVGWLPRGGLLAVLRVTHPNDDPDWRFLSVADMRGLFPDGTIMLERFLGMVKSIVAFKPPRNASQAQEGR